MSIGMRVNVLAGRAVHPARGVLGESVAEQVLRAGKSLVEDGDRGIAKKHRVWQVPPGQSRSRMHGWPSFVPPTHLLPSLQCRVPT